MARLHRYEFNYLEGPKTERERERERIVADVTFHMLLFSLAFAKFEIANDNFISCQFGYIVLHSW